MFADHPSPIFEAAHPCSRYLASLGAKYFEKNTPEENVENTWKIAFLGPNGLKTRLQEKHIFHRSSQALGPGPGPAKKDGKFK